MKKIKFNDCICHTKLKGHSEIKDLILSEIDNTDDEVLKTVSSYYSDNISKLDWSKAENFERSWTKILLPNFFETMDEVIGSMAYKGIRLVSMWYQQYSVGGTHGWHIHGQHFTGVYYLEHPEGCSKTEICSPFDLKSQTVDIVEGDCIVFPAHWIHRGQPNTGNRKTIVSFNFDLIFDPIEGENMLDLNML